MTEQPLAGRSVFVTGAYGLLGSWLVKALLEQGARTTVLRRDAVAVSALALEGNETRVNVVDGDICDAAVIERALAEYEVDSVFHLAAQTIVGVANRSPVSTFEANIRGTWTVLEACRRSGVGRVVVAASDKAYGAHDELPYREELALRPIYPYDVSKAATDMIARSYWHTFGLPVAVTRLANIYGGGDLNLSRLVPECVLAAITGTGAGDPIRRHARARLLVRRGRSRRVPGDLGAARGRPRRRRGVQRGRRPAALGARGCQPRLPDRGHRRRAGRPRNRHPCPARSHRQWVDSAKLRSMSGWEPRASLEVGLTRTVDWYRRHLPQLAI